MPHGPYNHHFRKTAGFFLNLDISLSVVAILVQLATAIINSHLGSLEKFLMSRCQSGLCRIATLIFAYAPLVLFGLIPMMTGCDNVQNQEQLATTPAQSAAHDDHDHDMMIMTTTTMMIMTTTTTMIMTTTTTMIMTMTTTTTNCLQQWKPLLHS